MTATVRQEFLTDTSDAERKIAALEAKYLKMQEAVGGITRKSKEGHNAAMGQWQQQESAVTGMMTKLTGMVAGYVTIGAAIGAVRSGVDAWNERLKAVAETNQKIRDQMLEALGDAGQVGRLETSKQFLIKTATASGQTRQEVTDFLSGAYRGDPTADPTKLEGIAAAFAPAADIFQTPEQRKSAAELATHLGRYAKDKSPEQLANLAVSARNRVGASGAGQLGERSNMNIVGSAIQAGFDAETALAISTSLWQADKNPRMAATVLGKLSEDRKLITAPRGKRLTEDEQTKNSLVGLTGPQILQRAQDDPNVRRLVFEDPKAQGLFGKGGPLSRDRLSTERGIHVAAQEGEGAIPRQVRELESTDVTGDFRFREDMEFQKDQADIKRERISEAKKNMKLRIERLQSETGALGGKVWEVAGAVEQYLPDKRALNFDAWVKDTYGVEAREAREELKKQTELLQGVKDTLGGVQKSNAATAARASGREGGH